MYALVLAALSGAVLGFEYSVFGEAVLKDRSYQGVGSSDDFRPISGVALKSLVTLFVVAAGWGIVKLVGDGEQWGTGWVGSASAWYYALAGMLIGIGILLAGSALGLEHQNVGSLSVVTCVFVILVATGMSVFWLGEPANHFTLLAVVAAVAAVVLSGLDVAHRKK